MAGSWYETGGPSNYEAIEENYPGGVWSSMPMEMTKYEVIYTLDNRSWHWMVNLNTDEVTFLELDIE